MSNITDPAPLAPLGETDCHAYTNGVIAWFEPGVIAIVCAVSDPEVAQAPAIRIPRHQWGTIVAVATSYGLTHVEADLLAEAAENQPR